MLICVVFCVGYSFFLLTCFFHRLSKQTWTRRFSRHRVSWVQTRVFCRRSYSKHLLHEVWVSCRDNHLLLVCKSRFRDDMDLQSKGKVRNHLFMMEIWPLPWKIIRKQLLGGGSWIWTSHATAAKHFVRIGKVKKLWKWVPTNCLFVIILLFLTQVAVCLRFKKEPFLNRLTILDEKWVMFGLTIIPLVSLPESTKISLVHKKKIFFWLFDVWWYSNSLIHCSLLNLLWFSDNGSKTAKILSINAGWVKRWSSTLYSLFLGLLFGLLLFVLSIHPCASKSTLAGYRLKSIDCNDAYFD